MIPWLAGAAFAQTIALTATVEGGDLPVSAVQSMAWHALHEGRDHEALLLARDLEEAPAVLAEHHLTTLVDLRVRWHVEPRLYDDGLLPAAFPEVIVTTWNVEAEALVPAETWTRVASPAVYTTEVGPVSLPEVALQQAIAAALAPVEPPVWRAQEEAALVLPVVVAADDEYRARYGERWPEVVRRRAERAGELLAPAGFRLEIVGWEEWTSPAHVTDLGGLLGDLVAQPRGHDAIRIGFTGQVRNADPGTPEDVGMAYTPGRDVLLVDQQPVPDHDPSWDVAEEGTALAHELLHALGVPHARHRFLLMSATKRSTVHVMSGPTRDLARAAVQARLAHWDPVAALASLSGAAELRLHDPDLQVDYILENLAAGPGVPAPGQVRPDRISALSNVAMATWYLDRSRRVPQEAHALRQVALAHGLAAQEQAPALVAPLLADLQPTADSAEAIALQRCRASARSPWDLAVCLDL